MLEGEWKEMKDEVNIVALLQQVQNENKAMKNYAMNLVQHATQPRNQSGTKGSQGQGKEGSHA